MTRQERFERIWAAQHAVPPESLLQYRWITQEGYRLPAMAAHFRTFCETLDSLVIELPVIHDKEWANTNAERCAMRDAIGLCKKRIEAAGLRVKP